MKGTPVFETGELISEPVNIQEVTGNTNPVLKYGLPEPLKNDADVDRLMDCWPSLLAHVRQTIVTLAESVSSE